jgi:2-keto-4-pentenoate hydratase/2-oxohepta-3-ene-1,7-dioic acid hydratase in catechol pathway
MRLVAFEDDGRAGFGCVVGSDVLVLSEGRGAERVRAAIAEAGTDPRTPVGTLLELLQAGDQVVQGLARRVDREPARDLRPLSDLRILAPIAPSKIIAIGRNYRDHADEAAMDLPAMPRLFPKLPGTVIGTGESIRKPARTEQLDWEVELAVVIGRRASRVSVASALEHVAGYTIINDVSARDIQLSVPEQLTLAKNFRTFTPMGSWIVTRDELPDPRDIGVRCWVNDELMQDASSRDLIFDIPFLVSFLSGVLDLEIGDVISTGTPSGVGVFRTPPVFLRAGDHIRMELGDGVCLLENDVVDDEPAA